VSTIPETPTVTIIIPLHPLARECAALKALEGLDYPPGKWEVILAKGSQPSAQRNRAAREAKGDLLYFLDDDSCAHPKMLRRAADLLGDGAVAAGGPNLAPPGGSLMERAVGVVFTSRFGTYRIKARYSSVGARREAGETDIILCNFCIRREFFLECGEFNERLYPNEENELFRRIRQTQPQAKVLYDPDLVVYRQRPNAFGAYVRKIFGYGRGRMLQTLVRPHVSALVFLAPVGLLAYFLALPFLALLAGKWAFAPLAGYLVADAVASLKHGLKNRSPALALLLLALYPATHLAYAAGIASELLTGALRNRKNVSAKVELVQWNRP